jgi:uncharacterized membrane protein YeaQ/YmgE (transglycosylase-associated protein family)
MGPVSRKGLVLSRRQFRNDALGPAREFGQLSDCRGFGQDRAMTGNVIPLGAATLNLNLDWQTILIWAIVGLVAGFLASHVMLGHGMGLFGDIIVGVIGGIGANLLANYFNIHFAINGHPLISQMVVAFIGALILLMILRLFGMGRGRSRSRAY